MNSSTVYSVLIISLLLVGALAPAPASAKKVLFYGKPKVLQSQLLAAQQRKLPCPKGQMRDHRNRCRRAMIFSRLTPR